MTTTRIQNGKVFQSSGLQIVIQPGSPEFAMFTRQFEYLLQRLIRTTKFNFVPLVMVMPGWVVSNDFENYWFETVSIIPEADWKIMGETAKELGKYIVRIRLFYSDERVKIDNLPNLSDDKPKQPYLEVESIVQSPYKLTSIKGLENANPARWSEITANLSRGEFLFSRRKFRPGRSKGSGWFRSTTDFESALKDILRQCSKRPTQLDVLMKLDAHSLCQSPPKNPRTQNHTKLLRDWIKDAELTNFNTAIKKFCAFPIGE